MNDILTELVLKTGSIGVAFILSVVGGLASAVYQYGKERRNIPPTFDVIDFIIVLFTSPFAGIVFYFAGTMITEKVEVLWSLAALGAVSGLGTLITVKDNILAMMEDYLKGSLPTSGDKDER